MVNTPYKGDEEMLPKQEEKSPIAALKTLSPTAFYWNPDSSSETIDAPDGSPVILKARTEFPLIRYLMSALIQTNVPAAILNMERFGSR